MMQENSFISTKNHDVVYNHLLQDRDQDSNKYIWQSFLDFKDLVYIDERTVSEG